ncbi:MAG: DNA repair protein RecO [Candidatus Polarisedimenticolia bacterium]
MPLKTSEAFVIDVRRMREADRLVVLFTEDEGKVSGVAASAAKSHRRFGGKLERLSRVRVTWFEKEGRDLARLDACELLDGSFCLYQNLRSAMLLGYVAEVVDTFVRDREPERRYYRLVRSVMDALRAGADAALLARYFEVWTLRLHGLMPELDRCGSCGRPLDDGAFLDVDDQGDARCTGCRTTGRWGRGTLRLPAGALAVMQRWRRLSPQEEARGGMSPLAQPAVLDEIEAFTSAVLAAFVGQPFRSTRFLRETLREVSA